MNNIKNIAKKYLTKIYGEHYKQTINTQIDNCELVFYNQPEVSYLYYNKKYADQKADAYVSFFAECGFNTASLKNKLTALNPDYNLNTAIDLNSSTATTLLQKMVLSHTPFYNLKKDPISDGAKLYNTIKDLQQIDQIIELNNYNKWITTKNAAVVFAAATQFNANKLKLDQTLKALNDEHKTNLDRNRFMLYTKFNSYLPCVENFAAEAKRLDTENNSLLKDFFEPLNKISNSAGTAIEKTSEQLIEDITYLEGCFKPINAINVFSYKADLYLEDNKLNQNIKENISKILLDQTSKGNNLSRDTANKLTHAQDKLRKFSIENWVKHMQSYHTYNSAINNTGFEIALKNKTADVFESTVSGIKSRVITVQEQGDKPKNKNVMMLSNHYKTLNNSLNITLAHEFCHVIENKGDIYSDSFKGGISGFNGEHTELNEVITQLTAIEFCDLLTKDNINFDMHEDNKSYQKSLYEVNIDLVKDFYNKYKQVILHCKLTGDLQPLYLTVGRNNFNDLSMLIKNNTELYLQNTPDLFKIEHNKFKAKQIFEKMLSLKTT